MDEQQKPEPVWTWPERSPDGTASPISSGTSATVTTSGQPKSSQHHPVSASHDSRRRPAVERQQDRLPGEDDRSFAIRSSLVTLASTAISTAAAFGLKLDGNQTASLMSLVTGITTLGSLILAGRKQSSGRRKRRG